MLLETRKNLELISDGLVTHRFEPKSWAWPFLRGPGASLQGREFCSSKRDLLVVPSNFFAPSSVLVTTSKALVSTSFLLLVSKALVTSSDALVPSNFFAPSSTARSPERSFLFLVPGQELSKKKRGQAMVKVSSPEVTSDEWHDAVLRTLSSACESFVGRICLRTGLGPVGSYVRSFFATFVAMTLP